MRKASAVYRAAAERVFRLKSSSEAYAMPQDKFVAWWFGLFREKAALPYMHPEDVCLALCFMAAISEAEGD